MNYQQDVIKLSTHTGETANTLILQSTALQKYPRDVMQLNP